MRWLRKEIGNSDVRECVISQQGRGLSPLQLRYWELLFKLPPGRVDRWVQSAKRDLNTEMKFLFYQKKYSIRDIGSVLYGLVYFDDAESERMPRMLWEVRWAEIKRTILDWVKDVS